MRKFIEEKLANKPGIKSVSGKGLMVGIEIDEKYKAADIVSKGIENGVIMLTAKNKIRLLPPLNISKDELNKGLDILLKTMEEFN
jgi:acetylornithine/N-succinyldiaminopimelate aminotransferase